MGACPNVSIVLNEAIKYLQYLGDDGEVGEVGEYFGEAGVISAGAEQQISNEFFTARQLNDSQAVD